MCAISGFINWNGLQQENIDCVESSLTKMHYRGPDFSKICTKPLAALGHNRLSIIDLNERSNQPMHSIDGRYSIVFNGEIYNFKTLKQELLSKNVKFKSESDTEVLLNGYIVYGVNILQKLRGMFAFVIWDNKKQEVFAARDRFGEKPFYFMNEPQKHFCFSSNLSGVVQFKKGNLKINKQAVFQLLNQQYIDIDNCIYLGIYKLKPANYMLISKENIKIKEYWQLDYKDKIKEGFHESKNRIHHILKSSVEEQLVADVPVGVFLSGGTDSSIITAIASKQKKDITALTISTPENKESDEAAAAAYVARNLKINHKIIELDKNCVNNLPHLLKTIEPLADASLIPSLEITKEAKKDFKVMLSGDGGDEIFGGYKMPTIFKENSFKGNFITTYIINKIIKNADNNTFLYQKLNSKRIFKWAGLLSYYNNNALSKPLTDKILLNSNNYNNPLKKYYNDALNCTDNKEDALFYVGVKSKLPNDFLLKIDSASMFNSIESRAPFLDYRLIEYTSKLNLKNLSPNKIDKELLKSIGEDYLDKIFFKIPKKGFTIPYYDYLLKSWGNLLITFLQEGISSDLDLINPNEVEKLLEAYRKKPTFRIGKILYSILVLEIWIRVFHLNKNPNEIKLI